MRYFVLKDMYSGEPYEVLKFKKNVEKKAVQEKIDELNQIFEENADDSFLDGMDLTEYVLYYLAGDFDFEIIPWSNDDNLYI